MMVILPLITVIFYLIPEAVTVNPCTNGELIESAAITCSASQLIKLLKAPNIGVKCGVVLDDIRPCIISAIATDHNQTCTAKEKHDLILTFRDSIKQHLRFDVIQCLPVMNCTDFESVMYYLQVSCEPQFESFVKSPNCGNLCNMATCHEEASRIRQKSCSVTGFQRTIRSNSVGWRAETGTSTTDICCGSASSGGYLSTFVAVLSMLIFVVL